ncbi:hypothetical protein cypCar_00045433, partial [Cyprinus carpio]
NPSHLIELDLTGNDPGQSGVKELNDLLQDPNYSLKTLRFLGAAADEACQYVKGIVGKNPLLLRELNLSDCKLRVNQISALLQDKHCKLNTLILNNSDITEEDCRVLATALNSNPSNLTELNLSGTKLRNSGMKFFSTLFKNEQCRLKKLKFNSICITAESCAVLISAFNSNPSNLIELDLSGNKLENSGVTEISTLLANSQCTLQILRLSDCSISEEGYKALSSALRSNPSHLIELDLTGNDPGQSGVKELNDLLQDPNCPLKTLRFLRSPAAEEACQYVKGIVGKNPLLLRELNLSEHELGDTRVNQIADLLQDKHCTLHTLILCKCSIKEKQCLILTSALKSNPSHLRELDLSENELGDSGVENLGLLLSSSQCRLEKLHLCGCSITEKQCLILTRALCSNLSHLRELDLSGNKKIKNTGVKHLCDVLKDSDCKLERLSLNGCGITDVSSLTQCLANTKALQFLKELDLSNNKIGDSKQQLIDVLRDSNCELR